LYLNQSNPLHYSSLPFSLYLVSFNSFQYVSLCLIPTVFISFLLPFLHHLLYILFFYTLGSVSMLWINFIWINYLLVVTYLLSIAQLLYVVLVKHYFKCKICLVKNKLPRLINKFDTSHYLLSLKLVFVEKPQVISFFAEDSCLSNYVIFITVNPHFFLPLWQRKQSRKCVFYIVISHWRINARKISKNPGLKEKVMDQHWSIYYS
jgi:hypothetical protein